MFRQMAVKRMGCSGAEVVRFLGITDAALNRLAVSDELPKVEKYVWESCFGTKVIYWNINRL